MIVERKRHIAKTVTYRILSSLFGFVIVSTMTGSISLAGTFSIAELIYKPLFYYFHERVWYKHIKFGLKQNK
jgi:uncharacterized membrane protein